MLHRCVSYLKDTNSFNSVALKVYLYLLSLLCSLYVAQGSVAVQWHFLIAILTGGGAWHVDLLCPQGLVIYASFVP